MDVTDGLIYRDYTRESTRAESYSLIYSDYNYSLFYCLKICAQFITNANVICHSWLTVMCDAPL